MKSKWKQVMSDWMLFQSDTKAKKEFRRFLFLAFIMEFSVINVLSSINIPATINLIVESPNKEWFALIMLGLSLFAVLIPVWFLWSMYAQSVRHIKTMDELREFLETVSKDEFRN